MVTSFLVTFAATVVANVISKIFICDNKFIVVSSYNVLSKDGKVYDWGEAGLLTNAPSVIAGFRQDYFNF